MGHEILTALIRIRNWCHVEGCKEQVAIADKALLASGLQKLTCFECDGAGEWDEGPLPARSSAQISPEYRRVVCSECGGSGLLPLIHEESK
jgi:hypothetical protein